MRILATLLLIIGFSRPVLNSKSGINEVKSNKTSKIAKEKQDFQPEKRIFGGRPVSVKNAPYIALIYLIKDGTNYACGGTIYNKRHVITAAHCLNDKFNYPVPASDVRVFVGKTYFNTDPFQVKHSVESLRVHFSYNKKLTSPGDIAVIRLTHPINYTTHAQPLGLTISTPPVGTLGNITGWGVNQKLYEGESADGKIAKQLYQAQIAVIHRTECQDIMNNFDLKTAILPSVAWKYSNNIQAPILPVGTFCGYTIGKGGCAGDSGGPFVVKLRGEAKPLLAGLTYIGIGCGLPLPTAYVDISHYRSFIINYAGSSY